MAVVIETTIGDFTVDLYTDERPQTCRNFLKLCKLKYYNWNLFYMVQSNFIAQTGDPTATGKGGESVYGVVVGEEARYYEAEKMPKIRHDKVGLLSMVNCGNNMLGSQFFITLGSDLQSLDGEHCVFGEITEGLEIILKFNETICDEDHRPYQDVRISHTVILEDPYDDPRGLKVPDRSPDPTRECLTSNRIGADEAIDDTAGLTIEEIHEMQKEKEAKARATILEIVGDIPDADIAPPENVLFVCKLNPVTTDDDLEIIFSRFGTIIGCEIIRDKITGDSLQYAFIEFANRKSCEDAYFKMDNVLIDDRRIHVDFSQSVSKMKWRGKGRGIKYYNEDGKEVNENQSHKKNEKRYNSSNQSNSSHPDSRYRNFYKNSGRERSRSRSMSPVSTRKSFKQDLNGEEDNHKKYRDRPHSPTNKNRRKHNKRKNRDSSSSSSSSSKEERKYRKQKKRVSRSSSSEDKKRKSKKESNYRREDRSRSRNNRKQKCREDKRSDREKHKKNYDDGKYEATNNRYNKRSKTDKSEYLHNKSSKSRHK